MNAAVETDNYVKLPFAFDGGIASRAAIGLAVLATDNTIEHEWRKMLALPGVAFFENRLLNDVNITPETLRQMESRITACVELIRPGERIDVVAFGCTSASMVIGEERIFEKIRAARPGVQCTTPITGVRAGLEALGAKRIAILTPYIREINESMAVYWRERGFDVVMMGSFEHANDNEVSRIDAKSIQKAIVQVGSHPDVDAVFVSCTSLRLAEAAADIEAELGKPVTSSNHAMAWHALRLAGVDDKLPQFGKLFTV